IGFLGIVTAAEFHAPEPLLWLSAAIIGGASGGYGAYVRARWSYVLKDGPKLHTAFSLEGAIDEGIFVVGPIIATLLATGIEPASGVVFAALVGLAGGLWFLSQRETEPPIVAKTLASDTAAATTSVTSPPAILVPGVPFIAGTFVAMGAVFGSVDVSTVAFAKAAGHSSMAGLFLAFIAFGSMSAGLAYGAKHWRSRLSSRFAVGTLMLAAMVTLLLTVHSVIVLPFVMVLTGIAIAPTIINGNAMVQALVPLDRLTEGLAWIGTSLNVGASLGSWLAGMRIDAVGAHGGFFVAMIAGWVMVLLALIALPVLRKQPGRQPAEPVHDGDA
ncbi:MAG: MFS transporter, partial [Cellulomonadaceae bacterium]|nr:MFS transporter [Cellulomonadaceae bacterium]